MLTNLKEILFGDLMCIAESDYAPEKVAKAKEYLDALGSIQNERDLDEIFDFCGYEDI